MSECGEIREPSRLVGLAVTLTVLAFACGSASTMAAQSWDFGECLSAVREELRKAPTQVTLQLDNDSYLIHGTDRFYTNGVHLIVRFPLTTQQHASGERQDTYGWRFGQDLYTPANAGNAGAQLDPSNRPFAAWLYLGVFRETVLTEGRDAQFWRFGLDIGCLGPCAHGEQSQNTVHRVSGADQAIGWESQVRNGLGVQVNAQYAPLRLQPTSWLDVSPYVSAEAGNVFIQGGGGTVLRVGRFATPFGAMSAGVPTSPHRGDRAEWFLFGRIATFAVGYDATLQGGWGSDSPRTVDPKRMLVATEWGASYHGHRWSLGYSVATRSTAVEAAPFSYTRHRWGRLLMSRQFD